MNIIKNFIDEDMMTNIFDRYKKSIGKGAFEINEMGRWEKDLYSGNFGPVYILDLSGWSHYFISKFIEFPEFQNFELSSCFLHIWQKGSGIKFHSDGAGERIAATIYLNKEWDPNYGGCFLYEDGDDKKWYSPIYNECIWFKTPLRHSVSILSADIPEPRLSIQLFFNKI